MIAFFPEPYPDELVYSLLARYYVKAGYLAFQYAVEDLYIHKYTNPDVEFLNELKPEVLDVIKEYCGMEALIQKHTMFPSYGRFLPAKRKQEAKKALLSMNGNFNNLLAIPKNQRGTGRFLRYCPLCAKENREDYGEAYWHRKHQIQGIRICGKHGCYLKDSRISMERKAAPGLWDAQSEIPEQEEGERCKDKKVLDLTRYIYEVFDCRMDFEGQVSAADFLKLHLKKYRRSDSGASIHMETLYQDYQGFYTGESVMSKTQMQKVLTDSRWNFYDICQLAMFAGIKATELAEIPAKATQQTRHPVYHQVAEELGLDYDLVQRIGDAVLKHYENRENVHRRKRSLAWDKMDKEMLPRVKETVKKMYHSGQERPQRVTVSAVQRALNLPEKRLEKLPLCKAEILKYQESQKEYWAREAVWAYRKLTEECQVINWRHIRDLTNMRNVDFQNCKEYLERYAEKEEAGRIKEVI